MNHPENSNKPSEDTSEILSLRDFDIKSAAGKSEKITVNLPLMMLAQMDALVDIGYFQNRAEFIRFASLKQLESYNLIERTPWELETRSKSNVVIGVLFFSNKALLKAKKNHKKIRIWVVGLMIVSDNIDPDLFIQVVQSIKVWGSIRASKEIRKLIDQKRI